MWRGSEHKNPLENSLERVPKYAHLHRRTSDSGLPSEPKSPADAFFVGVALVDFTNSLFARDWTSEEVANLLERAARILRAKG